MMENIRELLGGFIRNIQFGPVGDIARHETENYFVSTVRTRDSWFAETAIAHIEFNNGAWIVVEKYDDQKSAEIGHQAWIDKMEKDDFQELNDVIMGDVYQRKN